MKIHLEDINTPQWFDTNNSGDASRPLSKLATVIRQVAPAAPERRVTALYLHKIKLQIQHLWLLQLQPYMLQLLQSGMALSQTNRFQPTVTTKVDQSTQRKKKSSGYHQIIDGVCIQQIPTYKSLANPNWSRITKLRPPTTEERIHLPHQTWRPSTSSQNVSWHISDRVVLEKLQSARP